MPDPVRIVVADDHPIFRYGVRRLVESEPGFAIVGEASGGREALRVVADQRPDVLLLDLAMPDGGGIDVLRALHEARSPVRAVLVTS